MTAAEQIQQWADVADRERRLALVPYNLLAHEAVPAMATALQAVLERIDIEEAEDEHDPECRNPWCRSCCMRKAITEALGVTA